MFRIVKTPSTLKSQRTSALRSSVFAKRKATCFALRFALLSPLNAKQTLNFALCVPMRPENEPPFLSRARSTFSKNFLRLSQKLGRLRANLPQSTGLVAERKPFKTVNQVQQLLNKTIRSQRDVRAVIYSDVYVDLQIY